MHTKTVSRTKTLVIVALFVALSLVGSQIRIFCTIAFDSLPGFLAALLLGPMAGAAIGFLGHFFTALTAGFPLSPPLHLVIAGSMAITMAGFGLTYRVLQGKFSQPVTLAVTGIVGLILNAPFSLACSIGALAFLAGWEAALGLVALLPALVVASIANIAISIILFQALAKVWDELL